MLPAQAVFLGPLEFQILSQTADWTIAGGVYSSSAEVAIGLNTTTAFKPLLAVTSGISIDTNLINPAFTIQATPTATNTLAYYPNSLTQLAALWNFTGNYTIKGNDLKNLVAAPGTTPTPVTIGGPQVTAPADIDALPIANMTSRQTRATLVPTTIYIAQPADLSTLPTVHLNGRLSLSVLSKALSSLMTNVHVSFGDDATYTVTADTAGVVQFVSKTGSGIWLNVDTTNLSGTIGSVTIQWRSLQINWDQSTKELSLAGQFALNLKDDSPDQNPFLVSIGDQSTPGIKISFATGLELLDASFIAGTSGGTTRGAFGPSGTSITVQGLFLLYDANQDLIGIGGAASMGFGSKNAAGAYENSLTVVIGNYAAHEAGLLIKDGVVQSFKGRFIEKRMSIGALPISGDITVQYTAAANGNPSVVNIAGILSVAYQGFSVGITFPPNSKNQGLVIINGDWDLVGGLGFNINGTVGVKDLQFRFDNLTVIYTRPANASGGTDNVWTISGGATLDSFFQATVDLANPGLIIRNGNWDFEGIKVQVQNLTAGGFGFKNVLFVYDKTNNGQDYEVKGGGTILLGFIQVSFFVDFKDGLLNSIGADFKAEGEDPGLPIGDTGLFLTEIGFEVDNIQDKSQWELKGTVAVAYGDSIQFEDQTVRLFSAEGQFTASSSEFDIDQADFSLMGGYLAKGTGSLDLDWVKKQYHVQIDVSGFDGLIEVSADFDLNQFGQVTVFADVSLNVPNGVPFIGGDRLASLEGLLYIDPVVPANDLVAAWVDINTYIFGHFRLGAEFLFYPAPGQSSFNILWGDAVVQIEQEATSHPDGYQTTFTPTLSSSGVAPNQALFTIDWTGDNEIGDVVITIPGDSTPVTIPQGSTAPISFTAVEPVSGKTIAYVLQPVAEISGSRRYAWVIAPDASSDPSGTASLNPVPVGQYSVQVTSAESFTAKLTTAVAYAPPVVTGVTLAQPVSSNTVTATASYLTGDPGSSRVDFYYTTDPKGTSGTKIGTVDLTSSSPANGTASINWDITNLTWKQPYYVFAKISDDTTDLSGNTVSRTSKPVVSTSTVLPYVSLYVQMQVTPNIPVDGQGSTLSGWPVVWQQIGTDGKTVVQEIRDYTDASGQVGFTPPAGTNWTVIVAPKNWDGFTPLPNSGAGQSADANGQLFTTGVTGGTFAAPQIVNVQYQNMVSIHGQASLDLNGTMTYVAGAGLSGLQVYNDLNNNNQWDAGEPRTSTDLGGYYDLRFPVPTVPTNYTIRLTPDANALGTSIRVDPDSTTNFAFTPGASYSIAIDPTLPNPRELFLSRDFLEVQAFLLTGVAYAAGPNGPNYGPGAVPLAGVTINLADQSGNPIASTTTGQDGGYRFQLPGPGRFIVSTAEQDPAVVAVPGRHDFSMSLANPSISLPFNTPGGLPIYGTYDPNVNNPAPLSASGDFFGDGRTGMATIGYSPLPSGGSPVDLYLSIVHGADSRDAVTTSSVLLQSNFDYTQDNVLWSVYWSEALKRVVVLNPIPLGGVLAYVVDPLTSNVVTVPRPAGLDDYDRVNAFVTDPASGMDLMTFTSLDGNDWFLFSFTDYAQPPAMLADFASSYGVLPVSPADAGGGNGLTVWGSLAAGDFDGDGLSDYAFSALNATGQPAIAYFLSRERSASGTFTQIHTIPLGRDNNPYIQSITAVEVPGGTGNSRPLSTLLVHRRYIANQSDDVLVFAPQPATAASVSQGSPASAFTRSGIFSVPAPFAQTTAATQDILTDMNGDGLKDLVISLVQNYSADGFDLSVLLNNGDGTFIEQPVIQVPGQGDIYSFGVLSTSPPLPSGSRLPSFLGIGELLGVALSFDLHLLENATVISSSYVADVDSPGSYGGYHFGFVAGTPGGGSSQAYSGTAYLDLNSNGVQDPGEPNIANRQIRVTTSNADGSTTDVQVTTDAAGRYTIPNAGNAVIQTRGSFPGNTAPSPSPAPLTGPIDGPQYLASPTVGGQGVRVGGSGLIQTLDYADSFSLGLGTRVSLQPNATPGASQLGLESHSPIAPAVSWSPLFTISSDTAAIAPPAFPYPGRSNAGSSNGFLQAPGGTYVGIEYGLRSRYVVQADFVQTAGGVAIATGQVRDRPSGDGAFSVVFLPDSADPTSPGLQLVVDEQAGPTMYVYDTPTGNPSGPGDPPAPTLKSGTQAGQWYNIAVEFDSGANTISVYVTTRDATTGLAVRNLLKTLDLTVFADGLFDGFSNAAVSVGANGTDPTWIDNFQVGAPYVGYQIDASGAAITGYDFGVAAANTRTGSIQGRVVADQAGPGQPFSPNNPPYSGIFVYLDLNGSGSLEPGEPLTQTDADGTYRFTGLAPGQYVVRQALPAGLVQVATSAPPDGVRVQANQRVYAINFSNANQGASADFNADTVTDHVRLVPTSATTTEVRIDLMSGGYVGKTLTAGSYDPNAWQPVGVASLGSGNSGLVLSSRLDHRVVFLPLNGDVLGAPKWIMELPANTTIAALADLDGNRSTDLILHDLGTGAVSVRLMSGLTAIGEQTLGTLPTGWAVLGSADLNRAGRPDLILGDTRTGDVLAWFFDSSSNLGTRPLGRMDPANHLVASEPTTPLSPTGSYLYWQNDTTGAITRWTVSGSLDVTGTLTDFALARTPQAGRYLVNRDSATLPAPPPPPPLPPPPAYVRGPIERAVNNLYRSILHRNAERSGLNFWVRVVRAGIPLRRVARQIQLAAESHARPLPAVAATPQPRTSVRTIAAFPSGTTARAFSLRRAR